MMMKGASKVCTERIMDGMTNTAARAFAKTQQTKYAKRCLRFVNRQKKQGNQGSKPEQKLQVFAGPLDHMFDGS